LKPDTSVWTTLFLAVAAALALSFLLTGCASSSPKPAPKAAADSWGACDHSRMVRIMLVCWQTRTEPVSDVSLPRPIQEPREDATDGNAEGGKP
jgi:hypothetical protein